MQLLFSTALVTGMRQAELRALQTTFIRDSFIEVAHGWDDDPTDGGLKPPKNGHRRIATIPYRFGERLGEYVSRNSIPGNGFVFADHPFARPVSKDIITRATYRAFARVGIPETDRIRRNLTFHSTRHTFATLARSEAVDSWALQSVVGHRSIEMLDYYSDHADASHLNAVRGFQDEFVQLTGM